MKVAITLDDAPMMTPGISRLEGSMADPSAMDAIREDLLRLGIRECVAFVIGAVAEGEPGPLRRWVEDGFQLGNHSYDHEPTSEIGGARMVESIRRCDALLEDLGAFADGRGKWFRFPLLDYGTEARDREPVYAVLAELGYRIAHASIDLFDHAYESALGRATQRGVPLLAALVRRRFTAAAAFSAWRASKLMAQHFGPDVPLVAYAHTGRVSREGLADVLRMMESRGAQWCSLEEAQAHEAYAAMDDPAAGRTGMVTGTLRRAFAWRAASKAANLVTRTGLTRPFVRRLGPTLPSIEHG